MLIANEIDSLIIYNYFDWNLGNAKMTVNNSIEMTMQLAFN